MAKFKLPNQAITLLNRGGLKFYASKGKDGVVFDSDSFVDPRTEFTSTKQADPLSKEQIALAQEEILSVAKAMGAEFLDKKKAE